LTPCGKKIIWDDAGLLCARVLTGRHHIGLP
jgi:hypothetical protein